MITSDLTTIVHSTSLKSIWTLFEAHLIAQALYRTIILKSTLHGQSFRRRALDPYRGRRNPEPGRYAVCRAKDKALGTFTTENIHLRKRKCHKHRRWLNTIKYFAMHQQRSDQMDCRRSGKKYFRIRCHQNRCNRKIPSPRLNRLSCPHHSCAWYCRSRKGVWQRIRRFCLPTAICMSTDAEQRLHHSARLRWSHVGSQGSDC